MLRVRCADGSLLELSKYAPALRLTLQPVSVTEEEGAGNGKFNLPSEVFGHVLDYLDPTNEWLMMESTCRYWKAVVQRYWATSETSRSLAIATHQMRDKWSKLEGFVHRQCRFRPGVSVEDLTALQEAIRPWKLPPSLIASLQIHNGEDDYGSTSLLSTGVGKGLYLGSRLLSAKEIMASVQVDNFVMRSLENSSSCAHEGMMTLQQQTLYLPLFTELPGAPRRVAIELKHPLPLLPSGLLQPHGRIVLVSSVAPTAPHFKVLAKDWAHFLTLV